MTGKINLNESVNKARIDWKINHFFKREDKSISSPVFTLFKSTWKLQIERDMKDAVPFHKLRITFQPFLRMSLVPLSDFKKPGYCIKYRTGIQRSDGCQVRSEKCETILKLDRFEYVFKPIPQSKLIAIKDLNSSKDSLAPGNTLSVFCIVRLVRDGDPVAKVQSPFPSTHGTRTLSGNLEGSSSRKCDGCNLSAFGRIESKSGEESKTSGIQVWGNLDEDVADWGTNAESWSGKELAWNKNVEDWGTNAKSWGEKEVAWNENVEDWGSNTESWSEKKKACNENVQDWGTNAESWSEKEVACNENVQDWGTNAENWIEKEEAWNENVQDWGTNAESWSEKKKAWNENVEDWGTNAKFWGEKEVACNENVQDWGTNAENWSEKEEACNENVEDWSKNEESLSENLDNFVEIQERCRGHAEDYGADLYCLNVEGCSKNEVHCSRNVKDWTSNIDSLRAAKSYLKTKDISNLDESLKALYQTKGTSTSTENSEYLWLSKGVSTLIENFKGLYRNQRYTDVTIKVKNKEFHAHKIILSTRSDVFASMFEYDTSEKRSGVVEISDCDPESFDDFLLYLYTGELNMVSSSNAVSLFRTADKYNLTELHEECVRCMIREINVNSFCDIFHLAAVYDKSDLLSASTNFFVRNACAIMLSKEWLTLLEEQSALCNELLLKFAKSGQQK